MGRGVGGCFILLVSRLGMLVQAHFLVSYQKKEEPLVATNSGRIRQTQESNSRYAEIGK